MHWLTRVYYSTLNAEILWCLKVWTAHFSLRSCKGLGKLFKNMFPDSDLASTFSLGKILNQLINYGVALYIYIIPVSTPTSPRRRLTVNFWRRMTVASKANVKRRFDVKFWRRTDHHFDVKSTSPRRQLTVIRPFTPKRPLYLTKIDVAPTSILI